MSKPALRPLVAISALIVAAAVAQGVAGQQLRTKGLPKAEWSPKVTKLAPRSGRGLLLERDRLDWQELRALVGGTPREWEQMPSDPVSATDFVRQEIANLELACRVDVRACRRRDRLQTVLSGLQAAIARSTDCKDAANAYDDYYPDGDAPQAVAAKYDLACLASFERRLNGLSPIPADAQPSLFTSGGRNSFGEGAIRSVALLRSDDVTFCAGLLRNDHTIITARHCFEGTGGVLLNQGRVTVQPVDGRASWKLAPVLVKEGETDNVANDWAVGKILTTDPIGASETQLSSIDEAGEVTLLAYFKDHELVGYPAGAETREWKRGVRWPRNGLCQVVDVESNCLQMFCQTVTGFSGAPIFRVSPPNSASPLQVVGFVSRPGFNAGMACGQPPSGATLAVAATALL